MTSSSPMTTGASPRSYQFPILGRPSAPNSPASVPTMTKFKDLLLQPLELPPSMPSVADENKSEDENNRGAGGSSSTTTSLQSLKEAYRDLVARVDRMRTYIAKPKHHHHDTSVTNSKILRAACIETLNTRIPLVLHQTYAMLHDESAEQFVNDVRSTFALYRAIQFVDRLQEAMDPTTNEGIEEQLETILAGLYENGPNPIIKPEEEQPPAFRLSPWVASDLCFDLPIGRSAHYTIPGDLTVEIESIVEFRVHDSPSVNYARAAAASPVVVTIESCQHVKRHFGLGAGTIGQATIAVRVEPLLLTGSGQKKKPVQVWGIDKSVPALQIKEARAVQLNAYPPKPRASIDLNTSYTYGNAGVTITMVITTCVTGNVMEPPNLLVELFMAPPKPM